MWEQRRTLKWAHKVAPHDSKLHFTEDLMHESSSIEIKTNRDKYTKEFLPLAITSNYNLLSQKLLKD